MLLSTGFIWVLLALAGYGIIHSILASMLVKNLAEQHFGLAYHRLYRLVFNLTAVVTLLAVLVLVVILPDQRIYAIPFPWLLLTGLVQLACAAGLAVGLFQTGVMNFLGIQQFLDPASAQKPQPFVKSGLYGMVRHPLYLFGLVFIWLTPILTWNVLALNIGATLYLTIGTLFEERKLRREFGEAYAEYQRTTPMFIPGTKCARK